VKVFFIWLYVKICMIGENLIVYLKPSSTISFISSSTKFRDPLKARECTKLTGF
jgi:hypothetical protein